MLIKAIIKIVTHGYYNEDKIMNNTFHIVKPPFKYQVKNFRDINHKNHTRKNKYFERFKKLSPSPMYLPGLFIKINYLLEKIFRNKEIKPGRCPLNPQR